VRNFDRRRHRGRLFFAFFARLFAQNIELFFHFFELFFFARQDFLPTIAEYLYRDCSENQGEPR